MRRLDRARIVFAKLGQAGLVLLYGEQELGGW